MNKAKLMLSGIFVVAAIAGALASKRATTYLYHPNANPATYTTVSSEVQCPAFNNDCTIQIPGQGVKQLFLTNPASGLIEPVSPQP